MITETNQVQECDAKKYNWQEGFYPNYIDGQNMCEWYILGRKQKEDRYALIKWNEDWYKIPFFVLEDLAKGMKSLVAQEQLRKWLEAFSMIWESSIDQLKEILKDEMPNMNAYKAYLP